MSDFGDAISQRQINERHFDDTPRVGRISAVQASGTPIRVRVDNRWMGVAGPAGLVVGDWVRWIDTPDDPWVIGKVQDNPLSSGGGGGVPNIWTCGSLQTGDTTWRSALGDVRNLNITPNAGLAPPAAGGVVRSPASNGALAQFFRAGQIEFTNELPTSSAYYDLTVDMSAWWDPPAVGYTGPYLYESAFTAAILPPEWWAANDPPVPTISDGQGSPLANGIPIDPSVVGKSGWCRLQIRIRYTMASGLTEAWLWNEATDVWVSLGTATLADEATLGYRPTTYIDWNRDIWGTNTVLHPTYLHGIDYRANDAYLLSFFSENHQRDRSGYRHRNRNAALQPLYGSNVIVDSVTGQFGLRSYWGSYAVCPGGGPLYIGGDTLFPPFGPIFDGAALVDPIVAASSYWDPSRIQVVEADPTSGFPGVLNDPRASPRLAAAFIWAVADRDGATLDENGWPLNWWPFGPLRTDPIEEAATTL